MVFSFLKRPARVLPNPGENDLCLFGNSTMAAAKLFILAVYGALKMHVNKR